MLHYINVTMNSRYATDLSLAERLRAHAQRVKESVTNRRGVGDHEPDDVALPTSNTITTMTIVATVRRVLGLHYILTILCYAATAIAFERFRSARALLAIITSNSISLFATYAVANASTVIANNNDRCHRSS